MVSAGVGNLYMLEQHICSAGCCRYQALKTSQEHFRSPGFFKRNSFSPATNFMTELRPLPAYKFAEERDLSERASPSTVCRACSSRCVTFPLLRKNRIRCGQQEGRTHVRVLVGFGVKCLSHNADLDVVPIRQFSPTRSKSRSGSGFFRSSSRPGSTMPRP